MVVALGVSGGALLARTGYRFAVRNNIALPNMPAVSMTWLTRRGLEGFEQPMSNKEARKILNISAASAFGKDKIRESHRKLLLANHPDRGGSTYIATKINEAKDALLGKGAAGTGTS